MLNDKDEVSKSTDPGAEKEVNDNSSIVRSVASQAQRRNSFTTTNEALKYVSAASRKNLRQSDKVTSVLLIVCILVGAAFVFIPLNPVLILAADLLFFATLITFMVKRLGILITLSERQSVLVWDIILGSLLLGVLLTLNFLFFSSLLSELAKHLLR